MAVEILTSQDLQKFKEELLTEIRALFSKPEQKKWLKSDEVKKILKVSPAPCKHFASTAHSNTPRSATSFITMPITFTAFSKKISGKQGRNPVHKVFTACNY
jgi:hypothetical protein